MIYKLAQVCTLLLSLSTISALHTLSPDTESTDISADAAVSAGAAVDTPAESTSGGIRPTVALAKFKSAEQAVMASCEDLIALNRMTLVGCGQINSPEQIRPYIDQLYQPIERELEATYTANYGKYLRAQHAARNAGFRVNSDNLASKQLDVSASRLAEKQYEIALSRDALINVSNLTNIKIHQRARAATTLQRWFRDRQPAN